MNYNYNNDYENELLLNRQEKVMPNDINKMQFIKIVQKMPKSEHIKIYEIISKLDKKIYSITDKETLFDLNDLPSETFWEIMYYCTLTQNNINKNVIINNASNEKKENEKEFQKKINDELIKMKVI